MNQHCPRRTGGLRPPSGGTQTPRTSPRLCGRAPRGHQGTLPRLRMTESDQSSPLHLAGVGANVASTPNQNASSAVTGGKSTTLTEKRNLAGNAKASPHVCRSRSSNKATSSLSPPFASISVSISVAISVSASVSVSILLSAWPHSETSCLHRETKGPQKVQASRLLELMAPKEHREVSWRVSAKGSGSALVARLEQPGKGPTLYPARVLRWARPETCACLPSLGSQAPACQASAPLNLPESWDSISMGTE